MSTIDNFEKHILEQQQLVAEFKQLKRDRDFYLRVLVQAVLTNGGVLTIDPSKADEAMTRMRDNSLEFGNGQVCFHKETGSMFSDTEPK